MKIICVDNFDRESISDVLVAENVNDRWAEMLVNHLNQCCSGNNSPEYFKLVPDDHKLYVWEP